MGSGRLKPGWSLVAFGDVVRQIKDHVDPTAAGLERYVAGEHMDTDDLHIRRWGTVGNGYLGPAFHARFRPGHVLYGSRRTYLRKVALADFEGVTANTTFVIETRDPNVLLPALVPFIMQTEAFHEYSIKKSKGSVNPYVNFSDIAAYEFALPPPNEQRRIGDAAMSAGALSEALLNLLATAVTTHAAMLTSLESSSACKPVSLGSLLRAIVPGRSVAGSDKPPAASDYGVLKVSAVDPHGFLPFESKTLLHRQDFVSEFSVRSGDLIMTRANTPELVGEICLVDHDYPNLMLCDKTLRLVPRSNVDPYLLSEMLQSPSVRRQLQSVATGTGRSMKNISQKKIGELLIGYPLDENATTTNERLLRCRRAIRNARHRYDECRALVKAVSEVQLCPAKSQ